MVPAVEPERMRLEVAPSLSPRDEAIFLLHSAAEVEHSLMVQYLYAAWSLPEEGPPRVARWRRDILQIAREEMAHFAAVQNLLRFVGGPLNFDREDFPFRSEFYPFPFRLEPLSLQSLARYIAAEMPARSDVDPRLLAKVLELAAEGNEGKPVNRVGALYNRLIDLIRTLPDDAFRAATAGSIQAPPVRWRADVGRGPLFLRRVATRNEALSLLTDVARQGEGEEDMPDSHFLAFVEIFDAFPKDKSPALDVAIHPNLRGGDAGDGALAAGRITHPRTQQWARVFNHHYRMLLSWLQHALLTPVEDAPSQGLSLRAFAEMLALSDVGRLLTTLPCSEDGSPGRAGAPFELPYSMTLPDLPDERWAYHRELLGTARTQLEELGPGASPAEQALLRELRGALQASEDFVEAQSRPADTRSES